MELAAAAGLILEKRDTGQDGVCLVGRVRKVDWPGQDRRAEAALRPSHIGKIFFAQRHQWF